jgi:hypothetical protein
VFLVHKSCAKKKYVSSVKKKKKIEKHFFNYFFTLKRPKTTFSFIFQHNPK